ncbi:flagellar basal body-associated FliL family protein [Scandinavium goeteborgense]|uniref:Flagellar protein FliL n=1 Tax=Scandinavium goeteborgense TaxID=1851514 RepID=A0A4R6E7S3_SCAGO|nr:flagellar basal body-associated FliL family protein [Scandinavium goeteborgense]QKN82890.1 flagellar basal body-associated FliL family protein [Scandinavium goeteborgense]TDN53584.1 flagellar basal body-associated protein FliL [Scandinavium goeteborgense]
MKKIIAASLISACLVVLIGGGVGFYLVKSGKLPHLTAAGPAAPAAPINPENLSFISMPETVVTLNDSNGIHHYVLMELALAVNDKEKQNTVRDDESLYQSIIVSTLSQKSFDDIQYMKVPEIRDLLANALKSELQNRHMEQPFCDVLVTKAVFQ